MKLTIDITPETDGSRDFCIACQHESIVQTKEDDGRPIYTCSTCNNVSYRVIGFGKNALTHKDVDGTLWHESVATFVVDKHEKILCFDRTGFPTGLLCIPAGHAEVGMTIEESALMELEEESGIKLSQLDFIATESIRGDSCSWGADDHIWHVYKTNLPENATIKLNHEGRNLQWLTAEEILASNPTVGVEYFCEKYFLHT